MEITNTSVNEKSFDKIDVIVENTGILYKDDKSCLVNMSTKEIIGEFANFFTIYSPEKKKIIQQKTIYTSNDKCITYINIYDAKTEKYIVENFIHLDGEYSRFLILQNPETNMYRLYDENVESTINEEFDNISLLQVFYNYYFVLSKNGKEGLYIEGKGIDKEIEYDDISITSRNIILKKDEKEYFTFFNKYYKLNSSLFMFDKIKRDEEVLNILYCQNNDEDKTYVYSSDNNYETPSSTFPKVDEIKFLKKRYFKKYVVKKDGKYGVYSNYYAKKELIPIIYDKIEEKDNNYLLYKDGLVGLYVPYFKYGSKLIEKNIDVKYDKIICDNDTYVLYRKDKCDLTTFDSENILEDCDFAENYYGEVIYKKDNRYGIFNCKAATKNYENIIHRAKYYSKNLYITQENGLYGVMHSDKELLSPQYTTMEIYGKDESKNYDIGEYYFKFGNDKLKLAKFNFYSSKLNIRDEEYVNIQFCKDVMLLDDGEKAIICDYKDNLLMSFPTGSFIEGFKIDNKSYIYMLNQNCYFYNDGEFEEAGEYLSDVYDSREVIKEDYPSLVLKK